MARQRLLGKFVGPALMVVAALVGSGPNPLSAQGNGAWQSMGTLAVPNYNYNFLSATPSGDLLASTHNSSPADVAPRAMPALLIRNPTSANPQVVELVRQPFASQRGFGGIAADPSGAFFVSADTGESMTSYVKKFTAEGAPELTFGNQGEIRPNQRCLGLDVVGKFLLLAVDWGAILIYDTQTGRLIGNMPHRQSRAFMRDIAVDPKSLRVFGVAQGGVLMWGGGAPWNLPNYQFREFSPAVGEPKAGEGISIDPIKRCILVTPYPGQELHEIFGNRQIIKTTVTSALPDSHLGDSALSFDGTTLFISDVRHQKIHVLRRQLPQGVAAANGATGAAPVESAAGTAQAPPVTWHRSYTDVVQRARTEGKPMLVYFRRPGVPSCEAIEKNVLLSNEFNRRAQDYVCVFEDAAVNRLLAYRFGVYRIPHIIILDRNGETKAEFSFNIETSALFTAMEQHAKQ